MNGSLPKSQRAVLFLIDDKGNYDIVFGQKKHLKGFANNRKALNSFPVIREIREVDFGEETRRILRQ